MVNVKELEKKRKEKAERNHELYRGFFSEISVKIKNRDSLGHRNLIHRIPTVIIGFPLYDVNHAMLYVITKLNQNGFFVYPWNDNYLYVDWSVIEKPICKKHHVSFSNEEIDKKIRKIQ